jgi:hypothetical protein
MFARLQAQLAGTGLRTAIFPTLFICLDIGNSIPIFLRKGWHPYNIKFWGSTLISTQMKWHDVILWRHVRYLHFYKGNYAYHVAYPVSTSEEHHIRVHPSQPFSGKDSHAIHFQIRQQEEKKTFDCEAQALLKKTKKTGRLMRSAAQESDELPSWGILGWIR